MAELLFRGWVDPEADVTVTSAGVQALAGQGIDRSSASALGQLGIDPTQHRARQFEPGMAADADLILCATREQRDLVMTAVPGTMRRAFTMKEFVRLVNGVPRGEPRAVVAAAAAHRGTAPLPEEEDADDVRDPYKGAIRHAKTIAEEITETVYATLDALGFAAQRWAYAPATRSERGSRPAPY
jgi:low molecular weight protein-tyrosine phosphatase